MKFSDIIGHSELKAGLAGAVDEGRVSHAQLFTGRSGYGVLALALAYARYLNCTGRSGGDSCGVCPSCRKIGELAHPDLHFVFPVNTSSRGGSQKPLSDSFLPAWRELWMETGGYFDEQSWYRAIGMDNQQGLITRNEADEVVRKLSFKSFEAEYKVMLIWLPEKMRAEASNALLKLLEEPWEKTVFIMVSESPDKLLPTIISRTQEVSVPAVGEDDLRRWLTGTGTDEERAREVARLSEGDLIQARRMAGQGFGDDGGEYFEMFTSLMRLSYNDRHMELLEWAENLASAGREEQKRFFEYSLRMLRESYMLNAGMDGITYIWGGEMDFCKKFSPFIGNHNIEKLVTEIELARSQVIQNGNARIIMSHFALTVSKLISRG